MHPFQVKHWNNELEGEVQWDIKIQVSYDWNQSPLGSSSTIINVMTEVRGQELDRSIGQQAKLVDRSSIISPNKT